MFGGFRSLTTAVALLVLFSGCRADGEPEQQADRPGTDRQTASGCGTQHRCVWVKAPTRKFVPQGLALGPGDTAYLSGYHWKPRRGHRQCLVVEVNRRTGKVLASTELPDCRHGGGAVLTSHGLWIAGAKRLWLLDPAALGRPDQLLRVWRVEGPVTASTITATSTGLLLATFDVGRRGATYGFGFDALFAPAADALVARGSGHGLVPAESERSSPAQVQGITHDGSRLWFASSSTYCGALTTPSGQRLALVPGAEGLGFDRSGDLWVVSESGAAPYQRNSDRPRIPTLTRIDAADLRRGGAPDCAWDD